MESEYVQVLTAAGTREEAERIAGALLEARLAACVQLIGPIVSRYWWKGGLESAEEWLCVVKTAGRRFDQLAAAIRDVHSYEIPEITALPITRGTADYLAWIGQTVG
jgi:periplasmic divalent cation tolerance protein